MPLKNLIQNKILYTSILLQKRLGDVEISDITNQAEFKEQRKTVIKGLNLTQHRKPRPKHRKSGVCQSPSHQKSACPNIRCFFCKKPGHIKANRIFRKIDYVFNRPKEIMQENDKKKMKKEKLKARKKARKEELKILDYRAKYMTTELIKKENKEAVFTVK